MTDFENFTFYLAKDLTVPGTSNAAAASLLKITNGTHVSLIYCSPVSFAKRVTDTSNAQNIDKTSPDTGNAANVIEFLIREDRASAGSTVLKNLMKMHFTKADNTVFRKGAYGILADDNPELQCKPVEGGGYKFLGFFHIPDRDNPSTQQFRVRFEFLGDHTILDAFL